MRQMRDSLAPKGYELIPINLGDSAAMVQRFVAHNDVTSPVLIESRFDSTGVAGIYRVATGTFYLVDVAGRIVYAGHYDRAAFNRALETLGVYKPPR